MVGLDAAGKTTMVYECQLDEAAITILTIGFNVETVFHRVGRGRPGQDSASAAPILPENTWSVPRR